MLLLEGLVYLVFVCASFYIFNAGLLMTFMSKMLSTLFVFVKVHETCYLLVALS